MKTKKAKDENSIEAEARMEIDIDKIRREKPMSELMSFSIVNIDKPSGPTSFAVDLSIKQALLLSKTSHFGTLDPMVTGVLPVSLSRACRLMPYFIGKKKKYVGVMHIHSDISEKELRERMKDFIGKIRQMPPVKSRVKREEREREVYSFEILEIHGKDIMFESEVEAGTYIRKLVSDLGDKIRGAHMTELRRVQASIFNEKDSVDLYKFLEAVNELKKGDETKLREMLIPGEIVSQVLPVVQVEKRYVDKLLHGSPLFKEFVKGDVKISPKEEKIAVFCGQAFVGTFKMIKSVSILAQPEFVLQPLQKN